MRIETLAVHAGRRVDFSTGAVATPIHLSTTFERDPDGIAPGTPYRIGDFELASRLSFFLWSSIPDDELLAAAERGDLRDPTKLEAQVRRLLADPRSDELVRNFAGQWLYLRNLGAVVGAQHDPRVISR